MLIKVLVTAQMVFKSRFHIVVALEKGSLEDDPLILGILEDSFQTDTQFSKDNVPETSPE